MVFGEEERESRTNCPEDVTWGNGSYGNFVALLMAGFEDCM